MIIKHILFISATLIAVACVPSKDRDENKIILSQTENQIEYAQHLRIFEENDHIKIEILSPDDGSANFKAVLASSKPAQLPKGYVYIKIPIQNLAILSATQIGMLSKLKETSRISAVSSKKYIYNPNILKALKEGKVKDLGDESLIPAESIISSGSDYLFYSDFGQAFPHTEQLEKIGITVIPNPDWRETHPLGKAEWIKLLGHLIGKEKEANELFDNIKKKYIDLTEIAEKQKDKPSLLSGNILGDIWWAPAGESYNAKLFRDAGGYYIYSNTKGTGSIEKSIEQILNSNTETHYWFNPGISSKKEILRNSPKLKHLPLMNSENIFCYSHSMNYFWENSAIEPHLVLQDLIRILHPNALPKGKLYFYKSVN
jgi:iron complex transport system substrate-binding protein